MNNGISLIGNGIDLFNLISANDTCYNDEQILAEIETGVQSIASIISTIHGFEGHWVNTTEFEKLSIP